MNNTLKTKYMKNYAKYILIILVQVCSLSKSNTSYAQQRAQYSQYSANQFVLNPAVAGTEDFIDFRFGARTQWVGLDHAPNTYYFSAQMPLGKELGNSHSHHKGEHKGWHGLGTYIYNDVTGPTSRSGAYGAYSYNLGLTKHTRLSMGLYLGVQLFKLDGSELPLTDPSDPLFSAIYKQSVPDAIAGLWAYSKNYYVGISTHNLLQNTLRFDGLTTSLDGVSKLNSHYFITGGVNLQAATDLYVLPSIMIKAVSPAPVSVDLSLRLKYQYKYWAGVSTRGGDSFTIMAGTLIKGAYSVSYSYDLTYSALRSTNTGTHEILIGFRWPPHPKLNCPSQFWH